MTVSGGELPYSYQWQVKQGASGSWKDITYTASKMSFFVSDTDLSNPNYYRCVITDSAGTKVTSDAAYVSTTQSTGLKVSLTYGSIEAYATDTFKVSVTVSGGKAPYTYQWYYGESIGNYTAINENTQTVYFKPNPAPAIQYLKCTVIDSSGAIAESEPFKITLKHAQSNLTAKLNKTSISVKHGESFSISVGVTGGAAPYKYSWYMAIGNGTFFDMSQFDPNASGSYFNSAGDITNPVKYYKCEVKDNNGNTVFSDVCVVTVTGTQEALNATLDKTAVSVKASESFTLSCNVTGGVAPYKYKWYFGDKNGTFTDMTTYYTPVSAVTGSSITARPDTRYTTQYLKCEVTDYTGIIVSSNICTITMWPDELTASLDCTSVIVSSGKQVQVTCNAQGGVAPYYYKWELGYKPSVSYIQTIWTETSCTTKTYTVMGISDPSTVTGYFFLRCTVYDSNTGSVRTDSCTIKFN